MDPFLEYYKKTSEKYLENGIAIVEKDKEPNAIGDKTIVRQLNTVVLMIKDLLDKINQINLHLIKTDIELKKIATDVKNLENKLDNKQITPIRKNKFPQIYLTSIITHKNE